MSTAMHTLLSLRFRRVLPWLGALFLSCMAASAFAQEVADPPGRVAHLSFREGGVVFAPQGEDEWIDLPQNRPLTVGDRLWSDRDARAELQLGSATLHVDGESHIGISALDDRAAQFILQQGAVNARVRELVDGENFEVDTPNVAVRALQPGDFRVDVDPATQQTRVSVQSGAAVVYGEDGRSIQLGAGQQLSFAGRALAQVQGPAWQQDSFGLWAAERNRQEDQSIAARHVPRGVVGYAELDQHGTWGQDPTYGTVWYPQVAVADWAPYRYGHWSWIAPWGWTWIDDAAWGFAPFHYGRWTRIHERWAWVPGRLAARPYYSPAMVAFLGGDGAQFSLSIGSGPAVGWYPLAPGEAWWPAYRSSPRYVSFVNYNINLRAYPRNYGNHYWRQRPFAVTAVGEDDFRRGRPVFRHWRALPPDAIRRAHVGVVNVRPEPRHGREFDSVRRLRSTPPVNVDVQPQRFWGNRDVAPAVRDQARAQREQDRLQRDAERNARAQIREAERARQAQDPRVQREQWQRQREQAGRDAQERAQREAWQHRQGQERGQREGWQRQRDAQRGEREAWQRGQREVERVRPDQPRMIRQVQPVQVPRRAAVPVVQPERAVRGGRGEGRGGRGEGRGDGRGEGRGHRR
jgi:hypothetical protein